MTLLETFNRLIEQHGGREVLAEIIKDEYNQGNKYNNYSVAEPGKLTRNQTHYYRKKLRYLKEYANQPPLTSNN